jgi:hypothetical protein
MPENLRKASLYFRHTSAYWSPSKTDGPLAVDPGALGRYPLNLEPRLTSGHFIHFDEMGLPVRVNQNGRGFVHNYTTMCGFALGHWDRYLREGNQSDLDRLLCTATYMIKTLDRSGSFALLRNDVGGGDHAGNPSAMAQGEALSVLCRAWHATRQQEYLDVAQQLLPAFEVPVEEGGVLGRIEIVGVPWYEEYVERPLNHVLNGMLVALFGLRDFSLLTGSEQAKVLFNRGVDSAVAAVPAFDSGYWSWYQIADSGQSYIASMGYHMLHVRLLTALAEASGQGELTRYAQRFETYARRPLNRCRAVLQMLHSKSRKTRAKLRAARVRTADATSEISGAM